MSKEKLIYVTDPLCGWCYGMAPAIEKIIDEYKKLFDFEIKIYGLCPDEKALVIRPENINMMKKEIDRIVNMTGATFGDAFYKNLEIPGFEYNSQSASEGCVIVRKLKPEVTLDYIHLVQNEINLNGHDPKSPEVLRKSALSLGVDEGEFDKLWGADDIIDEAYDDYDWSMENEIRIVPSLVKQEQDGSLTRFCSGYTKYEALRESVENYLETGNPNTKKQLF